MDGEPGLLLRRLEGDGLAGWLAAQEDVEGFLLAVVAE